MIAGMTNYQICWYFLVYSIIGWIMEVMFHAAVLKLIVNRGFLNGPVCPVYGFGMLAILSAINTMRERLPVSSGKLYILIVFLTGMILASAVELAAGWILFHIFHLRWWDYSDFRFNFKGYICLRFSIFWGIGVVVAVMAAHPVISRSTAERIPENIGWPLINLFAVLYLLDFIISILFVIGLNRRIQELNHIRSSMRIVSDSMSERIAGGTISAAHLIEEGQAQAEETAGELMAAAAAARQTVAVAAVSAKQTVTDAAVSAKNTVAGAAVSAKNTVTDAAATAKNTVTDAAATAKNTVAGAAASAKNTVTDAAAAAKNTVADAAVTAKNTVAGAAASAKHTVAGAASQFGNLYRALTRRSFFGVSRILTAFPHLRKNLLPENEDTE